MFYSIATYLSERPSFWPTRFLRAEFYGRGKNVGTDNKTHAKVLWSMNAEAFSRWCVNEFVGMYESVFWNGKFAFETNADELCRSSGMKKVSVRWVLLRSYRMERCTHECTKVNCKFLNRTSRMDLLISIERKFLWNFLLENCVTYCRV